MLKTNFTPCKPCSAFTIPTSFAKCITYMEQVWYLYEHKQNTLTAGENIKLTDNEDGTTTISASGEIQGEKYLIKTITPPEHYVAAYELVTEAGEKAGVNILIPDQAFDPTNIESEITTLQNSLNSVNSSVSSLQTDMTTAKADITGLKQSVRNIDTNIEHLFDDKQDKLTAGTNISIEGNVVSSTYTYDDTEIVSDITALETESSENSKAIQANTNSIEAINNSISSINSSLSNKQDKLTAGTNISIEGNVVSSTYVYDDTEIVSDITALETESSENGKAIQANTNSIEAINNSISSINSSLSNKQDKLTAGVGLQIQENVIGFTDNPPIGQLLNGNVQFNDAVGYSDTDLPVSFTINSQFEYLSQYVTHVFNTDKSEVYNYVKFNGIKTLAITPSSDFNPRAWFGDYNKYQFQLQMNVDIPASENGLCGFGYFNDSGAIIYGYLRQQWNSRNIYFTAFDPSQFSTLTADTTYYITMFF